MKQIAVKPSVTLEDLDKIDIRIGMIEKVEDVEGSDKLVRLRVDFGDLKRVILVGMKKEREDPTEIEGTQSLFVVNLSPRKMAGELSEGILFDIGYVNGLTPVFTVPEVSVPNGACAG
jgi:tRNA-binding protein